MIRICAIGNSHLASWKLGWDRIRHQHPEIDITFFGVLRAGLHSLQPDGTRMVSLDPSVADEMAFTSGGKREIVVGDYDVFCLVGLDFGDSPLMQVLYQHCRGDSHRCEDGEFVRVSDPCFEAAAKNIASNAYIWRIARDLQSLTNQPLFVSPIPAPSELILESELPNSMSFPIGKLSFPDDISYRMAVASNDDESLRRMFDAVQDSFTTSRVTVVKQPRETYSSHILTKKAYTAGGWGTIQKHESGLQEFQGMKRIEPRPKDVSTLRLKLAKSLARLQWWPSEAKLSSTTQLEEASLPHSDLIHMNAEFGVVAVSEVLRVAGVACPVVK